MKDNLRRLVRTELLKLMHNAHPMALETSFLARGLEAEDLKCEDKELRSELDALQELGLVSSHPDRLTPSITRWKRTEPGRVHLIESGHAE